MPPSLPAECPFSRRRRYIARRAIAAGPLIVIEVVMSRHVDAGKQHFHVRQRVDRHAALADFSQGLRRVGVVAHQRRHVERDRETVLTLLEQEVIAFVGLLGSAEAGELPHRPKAVAIPVGMNAARIRILTRPCQVARQIEVGHVVRAVDRLSGTSEMVRSTAPEPGPFRRLPFSVAASQRCFCSSNSGFGCAPKPLGRSIILAKSILFQNGVQLRPSVRYRSSSTAVLHSPQAGGSSRQVIL